MLPPLSQVTGGQIPNTAARLSQMAQNATLAPIQALGQNRGGPIAPPSGGGGGEGIGSGIAAAAEKIVPAVQQRVEDDDTRDFLKGILGEVPESESPAGVPQAGGTLPPISAVAPNPSQPGSTPPPNPAQFATDRAKAPNPLGLNDQQVAMLRGMVDQGSSADLAVAKKLVLGRAFAQPDTWDPKSPVGKLLYDMGKSDPSMKPFFEQALETETTPEDKRKTFTVNEGGTEVSYFGDPGDKTTWSKMGAGPRWKPDSGDKRKTRSETEMDAMRFAEERAGRHPKFIEQPATDGQGNPIPWGTPVKVINPEWQSAYDGGYRTYMEREGVQMAPMGPQASIVPDMSSAMGGAPSDAGGMPRVQSVDEYNALPPGTQYLDPQGNIRTKSGG